VHDRWRVLDSGTRKRTEWRSGVQGPAAERVLRAGMRLSINLINVYPVDVYTRAFIFMGRSSPQNAGLGAETQTAEQF